MPSHLLNLLKSRLLHRHTHLCRWQEHPRLAALGWCTQWLWFYVCLFILAEAKRIEMKYYFRLASLTILWMAAGHHRWQSFIYKNTCRGFLLSLIVLQKFPFFIPANFLVLKSVTTKDRVLGLTASTSLGMGKIFGVFAYSVFFIVLRALFLLLCQPGDWYCWHFLGWLNRADWKWGLFWWSWCNWCSR